MAAVSISEAARLAGKSRSAFYKTYIDTGRVTVTKDSHTGKPQIDTSELLRVFGSIGQQADATGVQDGETGRKRQNDTPKKDSSDSALQQVIDVLREQLTDQRTHAQDLREQLEAAALREQQLLGLLNEASSTIKLIEDKTPQPKKGFWLWSR